ncbi:MAG: UPF0149 family protein [Pseudomonadota bacterium]
MTEAPNYTTLEHALRDDDAGLRPAELHGLLVAALTAANDVAPDAWLSAAFGEAIDPGELEDGLRDQLGELYAWTRGTLDDSDLEFRLLLPDDEDPLPERVEALGEWCTGYLAGLGTVGVSEDTPLEGEVGEFVADLSQMARAGLEADADAEEDEVAFFELVEYARVGAMLVFETLRGPADEDAIH